MNIEAFLDNYQKQSFKYSDELISGLKEDTLELLSFTGGEKNKMKGQQFLDIYGRRAKQIGKKSDEYSKNLLNDLIDFCSKIEKLQEEIIDVWTFTVKNSKEYYSVFVVRGNDEVVSVIKTEDDWFVDISALKIQSPKR